MVVIIQNFHLPAPCVTDIPTTKSRVSIRPCLPPYTHQLVLAAALDEALAVPKDVSSHLESLRQLGAERLAPRPPPHDDPGERGPSSLSLVNFALSPRASSPWIPAARSLRQYVNEGPSPMTHSILVLPARVMCFCIAWDSAWGPSARRISWKTRSPRQAVPCRILTRLSIRGGKRLARSGWMRAGTRCVTHSSS